MSEFYVNRKGTLEYLTAPGLEGTAHCFSTRFGGVSEGSLASLNLGVHRGDRPGNVLENYRTLGRAVGFDPKNPPVPHGYRGARGKAGLRTGADRPCGSRLRRPHHQ